MTVRRVIGRYIGPILALAVLAGCALVVTAAFSGVLG